MRLYPQPLQIGDLDGFRPDLDLFGRASIAEGLTNVLRSVSHPTVMALDAQWGAGKTSFLRMWAGELRKENFPVVYFDAFENDYADDAFIALSGQIVGLVEKHKKLNTSSGQRLLASSKAVRKVLLRSGIRLGVKLATLNALDTNELEDSASAVAEELSELADTHIGTLITKHEEDRDTFARFRGALSDLPGVLSPEGATRPLIFIIDELDRCRPSYALNVLERIKHFFSTEGIHFVLGIHGRQLENSVRTAYGAEVDARAYLQKFVDVTYHLTDNSQYEHDA